MTKRELGQKGEAVAAKYYLNRGYVLVEHGYRVREGELDLVLRKGDTLVVAEVKTRGLGSLGTPAEAVNPAKRRRIIAAALHFVAQRRGVEENLRFDVVEVTPTMGKYQIHCIENAFSLDG